MRRKQILGAAAAILAMAGAMAAGIAAPTLFPQPSPGSERIAARADGRMRGYGELTQARSTPAEALAAAVEAAALGLPQELYIHFVQRSVAGAFYEAWHGKVPPGAVLVAGADQVNAGAEHGHWVPVTVWVAGQNGTVAGLKGRVRFTPGDGGMQIQEALLEALPLQVRTWEDASRRLAASRPAMPTPQRSAAPFYGRFRFTAGRQRFAVDALTGRVEGE